jgi:class 3 adenylate cyclase/tetratricopeptide (TPR) repeat protein
VAVPDERKLATVLFADVVGFTSLSESTDPELVARSVDAAFRRMADVVTEHGGTVDKYLGDCLMAVFGVPQSHDNDAERAVAAGLAMRGLGGDLAFSIGINSGEVMVTAVGRDGEVTVIGDAVNVAARLEKAAGPGEVLIGPLTKQLAGSRVATGERRAVVLKGKRDPLDVWEATAVVTAVEDPHGERPPLVGRDDDLAFLRAQWRRTVRDRRAGVLLLCGDAGLGKSRLIDELAESLRDEARVVRTTYPAYGGTATSRIAVQIVKQLGFTGKDEVDVRAGSMGGEVHPSLRAIEPEARHKEQLWAFRRLIETKAREMPILLVIEDVHRSGEQTLGLLAELVARLPDVPLLLLLAGRPDASAWLSSFPTATTVRLEPLSPADGATLVDALAAGRELAPAARADLVVRGGGNPLHLRELVAVVRARSSDPTQGFALPPTLQAILAARLDALPPAQKQCLQCVAVFGDRATERQVSAIGAQDADRNLRELAAVGLLRHHSEGGFEVGDPLMREVAYETQPRQLRGERHRLAADETSDPVERTRHLDLAATYLPGDEDVTALAAEALRSTGLELLADQRLADAVTMLDRARQLGASDADLLLKLGRAQGDLGRVEDALATLALVPDDGSPAIAAELLHARGNALMFRDSPAAAVDLEQAVERWTALGRPLDGAWAHANLGVALFLQGSVADSERELQTALDLFEDLGDVAGATAVHRFWGLLRPDDPRILGWLESALRAAEAAGDRTGQLNTLSALAWNHYFRARLGGPPEIAPTLARLAQMEELAESLGSADLLGHGYAIKADLCRLAGDLDGAADATDRLRRMASDESTLHHLAAALGYVVARARGERPDIPAIPESPDPLVSLALAIIAQELILQGDVGDARLLFPRATRIEVRTLERMIGGFIESTLALLEGDLEAARAIAEPMLEAARQVEAYATESAALAALAIAAACDGDRAAATALLDQQTAPPTAGTAATLVWRARAVLGEPGAAERLQEAATKLGAPGLLLG